MTAGTLAIPPSKALPRSAAAVSAVLAVVTLAAVTVEGEEMAVEEVNNVAAW